ncbi:thermonuclease family protein [Candidatus Pacearchaeota archaeon]|nr:thermonuclease family protein [Candidatus Pacearchaeota archaeon]
MKKKHAITLSLLITAFLASSIYFFHALNNANASSKEKVFVSRIIDGDTLQLGDGRTIRLVNINTPEKGELGSDLAKKFLKNYENKTIEIEFLDNDRYSRNLSRIYYNSYINLDIVKLGLAKKFLVQTSEKKQFAEAEAYAVENSLGIWKKSPHYGCFKARIDAKNETAYLRNTCKEIRAIHWTVKDESRKSYSLDDIVLGEVKIHSRYGKNTARDIFLNADSDIWNNDRDTLYLLDNNGRIALHYAYGY